MEKLPGEFVARMRRQLGGEAEAFFLALEEPSPVSIRLHHLKGRTAFADPGPVPWCANGYYLDRRPFFHLDPHWHGGAYYVQEASSMFLDYVLKQILKDDTPKIFLDVCAAPGGKTGILASHMGPQDVLVANEVVPQRRAILRENLYKGGYLNTFISAEQATSFTEPFADVMLIDAPCAGEGMMRKDEEAIKQWSTELVKDCALMQQRIVVNAAKALRPGGYLIYSTCSYSLAENLENVEDFVKSLSFDPVIIPVPPEWNIEIQERNGVTGYQLYPHKVKGEGLFFSVLQNNSGSSRELRRHKKSNEYFTVVPDWWKTQLGHAELRVLMNNRPNHAFITAPAMEKANEVLHHLPRAELIAEAGALKGKDFIPSHFLAMSNLTGSAYNEISSSLDHSLDFLERKSNLLPAGLSPGWYLINFDGTALGWAKNTSSGWKNYYPLNWRLRSRKISGSSSTD